MSGLNPIYIATWFGLAGWALLTPIPLVVATLFCWGLLYVVAIFMEEKWLAQEYGKSYHEYCRKVRRFLIFGEGWRDQSGLILLKNSKFQISEFSDKSRSNQ